MGAAGFISVKNFERFQHYKDRSPPWIKLYNDLLGDYEFGLLPDASKVHLVLIWLLASRLDNRIPADPAWIGRQISATEPVKLGVLASAGFITMSQDASAVLADCYPSRTRGEGEGETEESDAIASSSTSEKPDADVLVVFEYWRKTTGRDARTKLNAERTRKVSTRLKRFTVDELKKAIDGVMLSDFHRGKYDELASIFLNDTRVEEHIRRTSAPLKAGSAALAELVNDLIELFNAGGAWLATETTREIAYGELEETHADTWARAGPVFRELRFSALQNVRHNPKDMRREVEQQALAIRARSNGKRDVDRSDNGGDLSGPGVSDSGSVRRSGDPGAVARNGIGPTR